MVTGFLEAYPKDHKVKIEDNAAALGDAIRLKRKPPHHANTEHELEVHLRNEFDFWKRASLTLQETRSIHDSMNLPKIEFIANIYILL